MIDPPSAQPNNRPELNRPDPTPQPQIPPASKLKQLRKTSPEKTGPALKQQQHPQPKPITPEEKKRQDEQRKRDEKP